MPSALLTRLRLRLLLLTAGCVLALACGSTPGPTDGGGGGVAGGSATGGGTAGGSAGGAAGGTAGGAAGGSAVGMEQEPNNGASATELDSITVPGAKTGAIGTADDLDIFTAVLTAGQSVRWTVDAQGSSLAPHLSVSEAANSVPVLVARGQVGAAVTLEQLVVKSGTYAIIVRDSRNVPSSGSAHQGSALHTYLLAGAASTRAATALAVPGQLQATLTNRYASGLFSFTLASPTLVTLTVKAQGKAPPSDLDSRLTLFNVTTGAWLGTNDDLSGASTDSRLTGTLPAGEYRAVVDNVSETANDLSYELVATSP